MFLAPVPPQGFGDLRLALLATIVAQAGKRSGIVLAGDDRIQSRKANVVVLGVQGHAEYGNDSPLLRAMGYIPASERKSGLTRRATAVKTAAANEEAAA